MRDRLLVLATLLITPLIAGCAQIKSFSVAPSTVCPGEVVQIDWKASDKVTVNAVPSLEGAGAGPAEGSRSFAPAQNTRFVLEVAGLLRNAQREWDVTVIPSQSSRLLGGVAQCEGTPPVVSASFSIQQKDSSSRVRAVSIENNYRRPLTVSKDDIAVEIAAGGATNQFKNIPVIGTWTIHMPIGAEEACDSVLEAVNGRLTIKTQMSCGG
ncbi:MAG TPA: hypothetical protein VF780_04595 [Nitrosospira sp.]